MPQERLCDAERAQGGKDVFPTGCGETSWKIWHLNITLSGLADTPGENGRKGYLGKENVENKGTEVGG